MSCEPNNLYYRDLLEILDGVFFKLIDPDIPIPPLYNGDRSYLKDVFDENHDLIGCIFCAVLDERTGSE